MTIISCLVILFHRKNHTHVLNVRTVRVFVLSSTSPATAQHLYLSQSSFSANSNTKFCFDEFLQGTTRVLKLLFFSLILVCLFFSLRKRQVSAVGARSSWLKFLAKLTVVPRVPGSVGGGGGCWKTFLVSVFTVGEKKITSCKLFQNFFHELYLFTETHVICCVLVYVCSTLFSTREDLYISFYYAYAIEIMMYICIKDTDKRYAMRNMVKSWVNGIMWIVQRTTSCSAFVVLLWILLPFILFLLFSDVWMCIL